MFFSVLATALVVLAGSTRAIPATSAVPSAPGGCATPSDGSFKLTAVTADGSQKFPVKVLQSPGENPNITQFIMLVANDQACSRCKVPLHWELKTMVLEPILSTDPSVLPTINNNLFPGEPILFTRNATDTFPVFCSENGGSAAAKTLRVAGSDTDFGLCGPPEGVAPIVYKPPQDCTPINLVLEDA